MDDKNGDFSYNSNKNMKISFGFSGKYGRIEIM